MSVFTAPYTPSVIYPRNAYRNRVDDVLREEDTLELNQEEVQELLHILQHSLDGILRDGVIFTRTERAREALGHNGLSGNFEGSSDCIDQSARDKPK